MIEIFKDYFIIIPLVLLTITIFLIIRLLKRKKETIEITGEIIDFYENWRKEVYNSNNGKVTLACRDGNVDIDVCEELLVINSSDTKKISPIISYKLNDKVYNIMGNYYSYKMKKGDKITLVYNENNPKKAKIKQGLNFGVMILSILTVISFIVLIILKTIV